MNYTKVDINQTGNSSILIIYTGGTFGMVKNESGTLVPFNFEKVVDRIPELKSLGIKLSVISFSTPIDSSDVNSDDWKNIAQIIFDHYDDHHGFVILHGTDTMAYTSSMLSFMLNGLNKPVILTGAQVPIGFVRSDARENLITALQIAAMEEDGRPKVSEVCIYFDNVLLRGNRAQKISSSQFDAFASENYPELAEAGIFIEFNDNALWPYNPDNVLELQKEVDPNVAILKIFPGINESVVRGTVFANGLSGLVLESFGSGNVMSAEWFLTCLKEAVDNGLIILNVSQCIGGEVMHGRYETSKKLDEIGVLSGGDITTEAAVSKLMFLLGARMEKGELLRMLTTPLRGEMDG